MLSLTSAMAWASLGDQGLDALDDSDPDSEFEPVEFREILVTALVLAAADVMTLGFSSVMAGSDRLWSGWRFHDWELPGRLPVTLVAAALMSANVWGLLRVRTWALFSNIASNLAIAVLALFGGLAANIIVSLGLVTTAALQLILVAPILAAALGQEGAGIGHRRAFAARRWWVAGLVLATLVLAASGWLWWGFDGGGYSGSWGERFF